MHSIKLLVDRPSMSIAVSHSLVVTRFGETTVKDLDELLQVQQRVVKEFGVVSSLALVPTTNGATKIGDGIKEKSAELIRSLGKAQLGSATVLLGKGLSSTIIRSFMTGFILFSKSPCPQKVFSDGPEALAWLGGLPGQRPEVSRLTLGEVMSAFPVMGSAKAA